MMYLGYWLGQFVGDGVKSAIWAMMTACLLPYLVAMMGKKLGNFQGADNADPRAFWAKTTGIASRANAAQTNGFESLPIFLASVMIAMYVFVPQQVINGIAWLYVALRVLYNGAYLTNYPTLRSVLWGLSFLCILTLFMISLRML